MRPRGVHLWRQEALGSSNGGNLASKPSTGGSLSTGYGLHTGGSPGTGGPPRDNTQAQHAGITFRHNTQAQHAGTTRRHNTQAQHAVQHAGTTRSTTRRRLLDLSLETAQGRTCTSHMHFKPYYALCTRTSVHRRPPRDPTTVWRRGWYDGRNRNTRRTPKAVSHLTSPPALSARRRRGNRARPHRRGRISRCAVRGRPGGCVGEARRGCVWGETIE